MTNLYSILTKLILWPMRHLKNGFFTIKKIPANLFHQNLVSKFINYNDRSLLIAYLLRLKIIN